ncbi:hypothetical protein G6F63_016834 [Rhizopus arrhizus]|nr:hypothetical protein G6F63_016834 [Rhizopus arrhizus]
MALGLAESRHAPHHHVLFAEAQFGADFGADFLQSLPRVVQVDVAPARRNRDRRHDADVLGWNAAVGQQLLDEAAHGQHPVREPGIGQQ